MTVQTPPPFSSSQDTWLPRPWWGLCWMAVVLGVLAAVLLTWRTDRLQTDVMSLLPAERTSAMASRDEVDHFNQLIAEQVVWVIKAPIGAVKDFYQQLDASGHFMQLRGPMPDEEQTAWGKDAMALRLALSNPDLLARLSTPEGEARWVRQTLGQLFSPMAAPGLDELQTDPFLLMRTSRLQKGGLFPITLAEGWLAVPDAKMGEKWFLISGLLKPEIATGRGAADWVASIEKAESALLSDTTGAQLYHQGSVFYTAWASQSASADINLLGGVSLVGLTLLLWVAYRSLIPLALCLSSIAAGAIVGVGATLLVFGTIHALTLVMCISLVGLCADYTTYYVARRRYFGATETPLTSLLVLRPSLVHAIVSTALAYAVMMLAPFPGLKQLAVFSVAGLTASWLTVYLTFPWLVKRLPSVALPAPTLARWPQFWMAHPRVGVILTLLVTGLALVGLYRGHYNDDLRMLQTPSTELTAHEAGLKALIGRDFSQTGFIVRGKTAEEALQHLEHLDQALAKLAQEKVIGQWVNAFPLSEKTQTAIDAKLKDVTPALSEAFADAGLTGLTITPPPVVSFTAWQKTHLGAENASFIYEAPSGEVSLLIPVTGVTNNARVAEVAQTMPDVVWHNRRADIEASFQETRETLMMLLGLAWVLVSASLIHRFGWRAGLLGAYTVALSLGASLAATTLLGLPINLFSLFALILILGISIDYVVFFLSFSESAETTLRAMVVALLSTLLSLGILTLSHTAAVMNFGWVLSVGVLTAFLFAPLALLAKPTPSHPSSE